MENSTDGKGQAVLSYLERNGAWIKGAVGCLILAAVPGLLQIVVPAWRDEASALAWLTVVGMVMGSLCLGYGLVKARTFSARVVLLVLIGLIAIGMLTQRPEVFMSKNERLGVEFSQTYKGRQFDTLRVNCWRGRGFSSFYQAWEIELEAGGVTVKTLDWQSKADVCSFEKSTYVIKANGSDVGYTVWTTGQEKERPYTPELVLKMIEAARVGISGSERQARAQEDWK